MTAQHFREIADTVQLVIDQATRDHGRLTPSSILMLGSVKRHAGLQAQEQADRLSSEDVARRARTLDDGTDAGGNIVPPALLEHADRLGATTPATGSVPVSPALVLIRDRLARLSMSLAEVRARDGVRVLAAVIQDLVMVLEQLEARTGGMSIAYDGKVVGSASNRPPVYPSRPDVSR